jgi:hypothetical protein
MDIRNVPRQHILLVVVAAVVLLLLTSALVNNSRQDESDELVWHVYCQRHADDPECVVRGY